MKALSAINGSDDSEWKHLSSNYTNNSSHYELIALNNIIDCIDDADIPVLCGRESQHLILFWNFFPRCWLMLYFSYLFFYLAISERCGFRRWRHISWLFLNYFLMIGARWGWIILNAKYVSSISVQFISMSAVPV